MKIKGLIRRILGKRGAMGELLSEEGIDSANKKIKEYEVEAMKLASSFEYHPLEGLSEQQSIRVHRLKTLNLVVLGDGLSRNPIISEYYKKNSEELRKLMALNEVCYG